MQCSETSSVMQNRAVDSGNDPVVWHSFGEHPVQPSSGHITLCHLHVVACVLHGCSASALQVVYL